MTELNKRLQQETRPAALFPQPPVIDFRATQTVCPCGGALKVQKSQTKRVLSLAGVFVARRFVSQCNTCGRVFQDPALHRWVPHGCNTAWDVMVFVGRRLFEDCRSVTNVRDELLSRDIPLSDSQISKLGSKFILYLALAHRQATPRIKQAMALSGGYILHLDAVHQDDAPALMSGIDELSRLVLANVKLPGERAELIVPFLKQIKNDYGDPIACVHDMGKGICKAVDEVFPDAYDYICHFHFLRDIGKDLLEPAYGQLRSCLRKYALTSRLSDLTRQTRNALAQKTDKPSELAAAIADGNAPAAHAVSPLAATYALALWILQAKRNGDGYGFPFDRPLLAVAERLLDLTDVLPGLLQTLPAAKPSENRVFLKFARKVLDVVADPTFEHTVNELRWRCTLFDQLRHYMRIAEPGGDDGLNDEGSQASMTKIRDGVGKFRRRLDNDPKLQKDPLCKKMAAQIDKYGDKLFADPIQVSTPSGPLTIYPHRTNNILEQFFRGLRRGHRRRTGDNRMSRAMQAMLTDTPLVKNLANPKYMRILLDGRANLEALFADLAITTAPKGLVPKVDIERILPGFKTLAKHPDLPVRIHEIARAAAGEAESNQIVWP